MLKKARTEIGHKELQDIKKISETGTVKLGVGEFLKVSGAQLANEKSNSPNI